MVLIEKKSEDIFNMCKIDLRILWWSVFLLVLICNWVIIIYVGKFFYCLYGVNLFKLVSELKRSWLIVVFFWVRVNILNINYFKIVIVVKWFFWKDWFYLEVLVLYINFFEYIVNFFSFFVKLKWISWVIFWFLNIVYFLIFFLKLEIFVFF